MHHYKLDKSAQKTWVRNSKPEDKPLTIGDKVLMAVGVLLVIVGALLAQ